MVSSRMLCVAVVCFAGVVRGDDTFFREHVVPILESRCVGCHEGSKPKGGLSLVTAKQMLAGGESGPAIVAGKPDESLIIDYISGDEPAMPKDGKPLSAAEIEAIRKWIAAGAKWPDELELVDKKQYDLNWWSLQPLDRPPLPKVQSSWLRTPIDAFILAKLTEQKLAPSPEADRRTLIRRLHFDLIGLPPSLEKVNAFVADNDPQAYEKLVDRLLASPQYGERWARHWLDVAHYGDTHGYDKDKVRPNAWPYRDYVIRAFNDDKPYTRFVEEQLAGDILYPGSAEGIIATGFIAAGPFDYVGQSEVAEGTLAKAITRNLDRDDMVATTINTFNSMTAQCARCHNHKFDPISQEDYYSLQAVFAGVDRADRPYDKDSQTMAKRAQLASQLEKLKARHAALIQQINERTGGELAKLDGQLQTLRAMNADGQNAAFGYHSQIEKSADVTKWVQIDLGKPTVIGQIVLIGAYDSYGGIGAGFGFPVRFTVAIGDDPTFSAGATLVLDVTRADFPNPGVTPYSIDVKGQPGRFIRITATKLATRTADYIFAIGEAQVLSPGGMNIALGSAVTAFDSIEALPRWSRGNLVDGQYFGLQPRDVAEQITRVEKERRTLIAERTDPATSKSFDDLQFELPRARSQLDALPARDVVFAAATDFKPQGAFFATGGKPRPVHVLKRGNEKDPAQEVGPGSCSYLPVLGSRFEVTTEAGEGARRVALARWLIDKRNPLTWRSIVNRVWQYHFGRGIVDSPNDFGRMGSLPSHPELLNWLAAEFRDGPQSIKQLHRLICRSAAYRQSSAGNAAFEKIDGGNQYLWRMNRRKLEAEAVRDSVLAVSGKLDTTAGGPGFRAFGFKDDHSPHYKYEEYDPDDPLSHRRSIYRFIVRSVPDPFMNTLDCADSSAVVAKRNETLTPLQALTLLNNKFMVRMAEHFAKRVEGMGNNPTEQLTSAWRLAFARDPANDELTPLVNFAEKHGLPSACRLIFNTNEFVFID
jgi:hypothetical protein